jgi:hypothetical protein
MATPTTSVRIAREHHQLIHDLARAIKLDPALSDQVRAVLAGRNTATQQSDTATQAEIIARLGDIEARLASLEDRPATSVLPATQKPRPAGRRKRQARITADMRRSVRDMHAAGHTQYAIHLALGISTGMVSKIINEPLPDPDAS